MKISYTKLYPAFVIIVAVSTLLSCRKEAEPHPQTFEPGINGVAVAPLPPIDESMAQVSLDDLGAVPNYRSTGTISDVLAPAPAAADESTGGGMADEGESTPADTYDFSFDSDDANSF